MSFSCTNGRCVAGAKQRPGLYNINLIKEVILSLGVLPVMCSGYMGYRLPQKDGLLQGLLVTSQIPPGPDILYDMGYSFSADGFTLL